MANRKLPLTKVQANPDSPRVTGGSVVTDVHHAATWPAGATTTAPSGIEYLTPPPRIHVDEG